MDENFKFGNCLTSTCAEIQHRFCDLAAAFRANIYVVSVAFSSTQSIPEVIVPDV